MDGHIVKNVEVFAYEDGTVAACMIVKVAAGVNDRQGLPVFGLFKVVMRGPVAAQVINKCRPGTHVWFKGYLRNRYYEKKQGKVKYRQYYPEIVAREVSASAWRVRDRV